MFHWAGWLLLLLCEAVCGGGAEREQWCPLHRISIFRSATHNQTGPLWCCSRVGGLVHTLGTCGSLQRPLLWGWECLLLMPQPPGAFSIRGLRLYFPELEPWLTRSALLPAVLPVYLCVNVGLQGLLPTTLPAPLSATLSPALSVYLRECGAAGSASGQTACPVRPTPRQSRSPHGHESPLRPGACLHPSYRSGRMFRTSLPLDFLSVLVVRGGAVCLPMPPSWFSVLKFFSFHCISVISSLMILKYYMPQN